MTNSQSRHLIRGEFSTSESYSRAKLKMAMQTRRNFIGNVATGLAGTFATIVTTVPTAMMATYQRMLCIDYFVKLAYGLNDAHIVATSARTSATIASSSR